MKQRTNDVRGHLRFENAAIRTSPLRFRLLEYVAHCRVLVKDLRGYRRDSDRACSDADRTERDRTNPLPLVLVDDGERRLGSRRIGVAAYQPSDATPLVWTGGAIEHDPCEVVDEVDSEQIVDQLLRWQGCGEKAQSSRLRGELGEQVHVFETVGRKKRSKFAGEPSCCGKRNGGHV